MHWIYPFFTCMTSQTCRLSSPKSHVWKTLQTSLKRNLHSHSQTKQTERKTNTANHWYQGNGKYSVFTKVKGEERRRGICFLQWWKQAGATETGHHSLPLLLACFLTQIQCKKGESRTGVNKWHFCSPQSMMEFCSVLRARPTGSHKY